jgi:DNA repair protein SbcD/Mre11
MSFIGRKFLHASDIHLGFPLGALEGCARLDQSQRTELIQLMQTSFDNLISLAVEEKVLFVVLAGDIYDGLQRQEALQGLFRRGLETLNDAGIPVYMVHGNHDPLTAELKWRRPLPPNVHTFAPDDPHEFLASSSPEGQVWVAGVSFGSARVPQNLAAKFVELPTEHARWRVGVLHTSLGGNSAHETYAPCSVDDLRAAPVGYWALGHIHLRSDDNSLGKGRWWAYSGNLQGKSFKPSECHPKGALLVEVTADGFGKPEFRELDTVRFANIEVPVDDVDSIDECLPLVATAINDARVANEGVRLVVRMELTGRSSLATEFGAAVHDGETGLLAKFNDSYSGEVGDTIVVAINSSVRTLHDLHELRKGDSLLATTLKRLDEMSDEEIIETAIGLVGSSVAEVLKKSEGAIVLIRERVATALVEAILERKVNA